MHKKTHNNHDYAHISRTLLRPLPLFPLHTLLNHIVTVLSEKHPELFLRLGEHAQKTFLIAPDELPFVLMLQPCPEYPVLEVVREAENVHYDAMISGSLFNLLDMVEGRLDGDAMFFSRDLVFEGDTEAVVALRNALDDAGGNLMDEIADSMGILSIPAHSVIATYRNFRARKEHGG